MKEYNFTNAEWEQDGVLILTNEIKENEEIKFDSTSVLLQKITSDNVIIANYSLICLADMSADKIVINKDLTCYGDIECDTLNIEGNCKCFGNLNVKHIYVNGEVVINNAFIHDGNIGSNTVATGSLEIISNLEVDGNLVCFEGILGEGKLSCNYIYADDYVEIETKGAILKREIKTEDHETTIDNKLLMKLTKPNKIKEFIYGTEYDELLDNNKLVIKKIESIIPLLDKIYDNEEILQLFKRLIPLDKKFKLDYITLKFIKEIQDYTEIDDLSTFLKLVSFRKKVHSYLLEIDICKYVFNHFLKRQKKNIDNMHVKDMRTNKEFANTLNLLEINRDYFSESEYYKILTILYNKIGISLKIVDSNLDLWNREGEHNGCK